MQSAQVSTKIEYSHFNHSVINVDKVSFYVTNKITTFEGLDLCC